MTAFIRYTRFLIASMAAILVVLIPYRLLFFMPLAVQRGGIKEFYMAIGGPAILCAAFAMAIDELLYAIFRKDMRYKRQCLCRHCGHELNGLSECACPHCGERL